VQSKRRNLAPQAIAHLRHGECERAALLARQAYLFNKDVPEVLPQVDTALREVLSVNPFTYVWHRSSLFDFPMIAFSPDGKWLAGAGKDGYVYLWDVKRRLPPWILRLHWERSEVCSVAFSNDGCTLATAGRDKTLKLVDLAALDGLPDATDREIPYKQLNPVVFDDPHAEGIIALAFRPGEKRILASGSWDGFFRLWDVDAGRMLREWHGHDGWIWSVGFSPDGSRFASAGRDRVVRVWDPDRNDMFVAALGASDEVMSLAFAPDGEQLAAGGRDETVWIWSKGPGREWNQAEGRPIGKHSKPVRSVAFSPDGRILASASEDETVRLWDPHGAHGAPVLGELPHFYGVGSVAFRPLSERTLFSSCWDRTVRVWDIYPVEPRVLEGHRDSVQAVSFGADNSVASASWDKTVRLWDVKRPGVYRTFSGHGAEVYSVALYCSPDMKVQTLASGCLDGFVRLWDVTRDDAERSPAREFHHGGGVSAVAFGADGATLASGSHNGTIRLWDLAPGDGRPVEFRHSDRPVTCVAFGNHGKLLASGGDDADVKLWSFDPHGAPELIATLQGHDSRVWSVGISPDGRYLASGGDDRTVQLWQIDDPSKLVSNNPVRTLSGHEFWVGSVAFSPDGRFLAAGGYDRTIRLWDLLKLFDPDEFNDDPLVLRGHQQSVTSVAFSPRGRFLVSGSTDNTVRIWTLELEELANRVCSKVSRNLSREEWEKSIGLGVRYQCTCPDLPRGEGVLQDA
jgi:WD40 repeat protein